ncbi:MAG: LPXTG cell wall anchor domain-containing protein [Thermoplasmatales archaeon]|nr:MAG: LPXTG cell wall anchor domain-containing protein [Thermoplasmatales archaeon]
MNIKIFRKNKTGFIFGVLLLSVFIYFVPISSAGIINVPSIINVTYPEKEDEVIPNSGVLDIPLSITAELSGPWAKIVERVSLLGNAILQIELKIVDKPTWCEASISNPLAQIRVGGTEPYSSTLTVTVTESAPAFQQATVRISATIKLQRGLIFNIAEETAEFDISFIIGYWCVVGYFLPNGDSIEIKSIDSADFQIELENLGNGPTYVKIDLIDDPKEGWSVNIASSVQLDSNRGNNKKSVHLRINPPKKSDNKIRKTFGVKFSPSYLGRPNLKGSEEIIYFTVESIGNLKNEEESDNNFLIILGVVLFIIILILIILKRRKRGLTK